MPSQRVNIAQAVVNALNDGAAGGKLSQKFTATRKFLPAIKLKDMGSTLFVTVVPLGPEKRAAFARGQVRKDFSLDIGIQKKLSPLTDPTDPANDVELQQLMQFAEEVAAFFEPVNGVPAQLLATGAKWVSSEIDPPYDIDHLLTERVFNSRVTVTFFYL